MDFVRLNSGTYIPDKLIEGYNSLVWTERYQDPGEFQLKSFDIAGMKELLPIDTLVSHLETKEVFQVETHSIEMVGEGADAMPEITVAGRSGSKILGDRWVESTYQKRRKMRKKYSATSALCVLLYQAVDNNSGADLTRGDNDPDTEGVVNHYPWTTLDDIPNVCVTEAVPSEGTTRWWQLEEGVLLPQFQKIMVDADLGLRLIRPVSPNPGTVITVSSALATRGDITRTANADISMLRFEIYKGVDRSSGANAVRFSQLQGHLDKPIYLESKQPYKSVVEIKSGEVAVSDVYRPGESGLTGWNRRTMEYDAGSPEIPAAPAKPDDLGRNPTAAERNAYYDAMDAWKVKMAKWRNKRDTIVEEFREEATKAALAELKKNNKLNMFAGDISILSPYQYKTHYDLGDTVLLVGDYGKTEKMVVQEYVRTEDANGDRGIPGLVAP